FVACFHRIQRLMYIENQRAAKDKGQKLIAVGSQEDLKASIRFIETESELLHLSLLCDDAELYPDLEDELRKTPAIEKRTRQLSRMMTLFGYEPVLMDMDEEAQLIVGNAVMRKMAQIADASDKLEGYRKATSYIDTRQYLEDSGLLESGLSELKAVSPITLSSLAKQIPEYEASQ
ncbi:MAG: hypothetical protein LAT56_17485, partial [Wenzhouxiangella sp.]|nr:hypothetical protein [Wenzhouxiangella sp.]